MEPCPEALLEGASQHGFARVPSKASVSLRTAKQGGLADLVVWYWPTMRPIPGFYEKRGQ